MHYGQIMEFKSIETAPIGNKASDQILCRFWYSFAEHWVYFVAYPNGKNTFNPNYASPEEWCELPQER